MKPATVPTTITWVHELISQLMAYKYTGKLEVNFYAGGVSNTNLGQSLKEGGKIIIAESTGNRI